MLSRFRTRLEILLAALLLVGAYFLPHDIDEAFTYDTPYPSEKSR